MLVFPILFFHITSCLVCVAPKSNYDQISVGMRLLFRLTILTSIIFSILNFFKSNTETALFLSFISVCVIAADEICMQRIFLREHCLLVQAFTYSLSSTALIIFVSLS